MAFIKRFWLFNTFKVRTRIRVGLANRHSPPMNKLHSRVMPISSFLVSKLLNLPLHYAAGLILLVGCCPGGTASNIVTFIARGNVALSVLMTAASTFSAVIMTPFLTAKLAGPYVAVDHFVLLPVLAGALLNQYSQSLVRLVSPLMLPIAVGTVAFFVRSHDCPKFFCNLNVGQTNCSCRVFLSFIWIFLWLCAFQ